MDVWQEYVGKKVFLRTRNNRIYVGIIKQVDSSSPPLHFIYLKDQKGMIVTLVHSEIVEIKEEL